MHARLTSLIVAATALAAASPARAATFQTNVSYGGSGAVMNVYVPDRVKSSPGIIVSLHFCGGTATNAASWFQPTLAEQHGFIVIAPGLPPGDADNCWDVGSTQTKMHNGGSHSRAISQMVQYAVTQYGADATRVFAAGASSGAMMTNILMGAYPDVFAGGSVLAGVPFGCWTVGDGWDNACAAGTVTRTAQQWGDLVRNAYTGYTGARPRVQLWHGTSDTTLVYNMNLAEEVKQWTNVLGLSSAPTSTQQNTPKSPWTRTNYQNGAGVITLEVNIGQGVGHDLTGQGLFADVVRFFGLDRDVTGDGGIGGAGGAGGSTGSGGRGGQGGQGGSTGGAAGRGGQGGSAGGGSAGRGGAAGGAAGASGAAGSGGAGGGAGTTGAAGATGAGGATGAAGTTGGAGTTGVAGTTGGAGSSAGMGGGDDGGGGCGGCDVSPGGGSLASLLFAAGLALRARRCSAPRSRRGSARAIRRPTGPA